MEGYTDPHDGDVILNVEMFVPSSHVGRIIGKGGANVRELQRLTGVMIKLPDQLSPPPKDQTSVVLIGKWIQVLVRRTTWNGDKESTELAKIYCGDIQNILWSSNYPKNLSLEK